LQQKYLNKFYKVFAIAINKVLPTGI